MKKALLKNSVKEIKNTYKRFISILLMAFLGVGFFAGLRATSPDMLRTIDNYYKEQNVYDIQVLSTLGLTSNDVEEISKIENVEKVSKSYETDGKIDIDEYNRSVTSIRNAIGVQEYDPHLFRFPGGYNGGKYAELKKTAGQLLEQNGVLHVDWNALTSDSAGAKTTEGFIAQLEKTVPKYNSVVVLMHDAGNKTATANALPTIIQYFRDRGFEFENFYSIMK